MKFLIEKLKYNDFIYTLKEAIEYNKWLGHNDMNYIEIGIDHISTVGNNYIPVGSVEFVSEYIFHYFNLKVKPINIPDSLLKYDYTGRYVFNGTEKDIKGEVFVKSREVIKGLTGILSEAPKGDYQISSIIDIDSEWRSFVHNNQLVGLQHYSGDFTKFPNVEQIKKMIKTYQKNAPVAYTLDVGILNKTNKTVVIEVHDFFSCGLYGFNNLKIYPYMLSQWYHQFLLKNGV